MAYLFDYHNHTARCGHAEGSMEQYVQRAVDLGLSEIGFSDHLYLYWLPTEDRDPGLGMAEEELPEYVGDVLRLREMYPEIRVRLGVEADFIPGWEEKLRDILKPYPWDYVYGSVHFIGDWGFDDSRQIDRYARWDVDDLYRHYFRLIEDAAATGLFDVMGHLDVIKKFGHRMKGDPVPLYSEVAGALRRASVAIEISSAGLRKPVGEVYPGPRLLAQCALEGVPATLGSDAHKPSEVGRDFDQTLRALGEAGYREIVRFERRSRSSVPLETP